MRVGVEHGAWLSILFEVLQDIDGIQFPIILRMFPSIGNDFSFHTQMFSCRLHIFVHFDAFMSDNCIQNFTQGIFMLSLLVQIWEACP